MLECQSLNKSFAGHAVVTDLSLRLQSGQILGLLGPNGAGKSTTVGMLSGLTPPDSGRIVLTDGALVLDVRARPDAFKRCIGVVPQDLALYEELPARRNLELFGALYGLSGATLATRVDDALALVGLMDRAKDKPSTFSGGMKRRLNIACALVHDPDVLLLDEPTVGVDPQSRNAIFDNLETLRDRGKALLYTTHYMEEAERLCDRIVVMDHGRVVAEDTLQGLLARLPHAEVVHIEIAANIGASLNLSDLCALPGVAGAIVAEATTNVIDVRFTSATDVGTGTARVLDWLRVQTLDVRRINSSHANLEDVFLVLTGRQLRDA